MFFVLIPYWCPDCDVEVLAFWSRPFIVSPWTRRADPALLFRFLATTRASLVGWRDPGVADLMQVAFATSAVADRRAALAALARSFACHSTAIVPVLPERVDLAGDRLAPVELPGSFYRLPADRLVSSLLLA